MGTFQIAEFYMRRDVTGRAIERALLAATHQQKKHRDLRETSGGATLSPVRSRVRGRNKRIGVLVRDKKTGKVGTFVAPSTLLGRVDEASLLYTNESDISKGDGVARLPGWRPRSQHGIQFQFQSTCLSSGKPSPFLITEEGRVGRGF